MKALLNISVFEEAGNLLNSRESATSLMDKVRKSPCQVVEFNFSSVEFMSRSFADQFYKEKVQLVKEYNILFEMVDANEEIIHMLRVVSNTQNKVEREYVQLPVYKFTNQNLLGEYLLSI